MFRLKSDVGPPSAQQRIVGEFDIVVEPDIEIVPFGHRRVVGDAHAAGPIALPVAVVEAHFGEPFSHRSGGAIRTGVVEQVDDERRVFGSLGPEQPVQASQRPLATVESSDANGETGHSAGDFVALRPLAIGASGTRPIGLAGTPP